MARRVLLLVTLFVLVTGLAAIGWLAWASRPPATKGTPPADVVVEPGTAVRFLAGRLKRERVIRSALLFELWVRASGNAGRIQAGMYLLPRDRSLPAIVDMLVEGETLLIAVTVPEGLRLEQTAGVVARSLGVDSTRFVAAATDPALVDSLLGPLLHDGFASHRSAAASDPAGPDTASVSADTATSAVADSVVLPRVDARPISLEGYLFPETYRVDPGTSPHAMARLMAKQFHDVFTPAWRARAESLGATIHQIVTLASIVEGEAKVPEERKVIAGVFWNRLNRGMRLEADPTVQYALGGHRDRVLYRDLEIDSPFNTYLYTGLPPGPIASPGRAAIEATLYPDSVPYLYFFATGEDGRHTFSETFEEHLRKRREFGR